MVTPVDELLVTPEGYRRLAAELADLRERRRLAVAQDAELRRVASPFVTVEYTHPGITLLDRRIGHLAEVLDRARPVAETEREPGVVGVGSWVTLRWEDGETAGYRIVGPPEANLAPSSRSYASPLGRALVGARVGERREVLTSRGPRQFAVLAIQ